MSPLRVIYNSGRETVAPGEFVSYDLTVANTAPMEASGVRLLDVLPPGFRLKKGSVRLNGISVPDPAVSTDGKVLTFTVGDLAPASSSIISFTVEVTAGSTPGWAANVAAAISRDGVKSDTAKEIITVRDVSGPPRLRLSRNIGHGMVAPGEIVVYDLTVANTSPVDVPGVRLLDMLPAGFSLKKGSVRLNCASASDPAVSTDGKVLTFVVGDLPPASSSTVSFMVEVAAGSTPGKVVDVAAAISSDGWKSGTAKEIVTVRDDQPPAKTAANITPVVSQEAPQSSAEKASGAAAPAADVTPAPQAAATADKTAAPSPDSATEPAPLAVSAAGDAAIASQAAVAATAVTAAVPQPPEVSEPVAIPIAPVSGDDAKVSQPAVTSVEASVPSPLVSSPSVITPVPATGVDTPAPQAAVTSGQAAASTPDTSPQPVPQIAPSPVAEKPRASMMQGGETKSVAAPSIEPFVGNIPPQANDPGSPRLRLSRNIGHGTVAPGEIVGYDLTVSNTSREAIPGVRLLDMLPVGFSLNKGSVRLNGISAPDPAVSTDGKVLTFALGDLAPASSSTISFMVEVTAGSPPGKVVDVAAAISSDGVKSGTAKEIVTVRDELPAKVAENITPVVPQETPQSTTEKAADATVQIVGDAPIDSQAAVAISQVALPSPPVVFPPVALPEAAVAGDDARASQPAVTAVEAAVQSLAVSPPSALATAPAADADPAAPQVAAIADKAADTAPDPSSQPEPQQVTDDEEKLQAEEPIPVDFVVQKTLTLAELIGMTDISVLSDVDGQFVKNMAENQTLENEYASQVDETSLLESIRVGRSFNRESRAALARTEQANAQTGQAFALLLPSVSVRANSGSETSEPSMNPDVTGPDTHTRTDASLSIRQPLFDLPSFLDWRRRKVVELARGENYKVSDGEAYIAAVNAYLSIVSSRLQTDMTREFEAKLNDLLIYVEKRAKAGAASHSDMARVRARSQATLSSRLEQESAHAAAGIEFIRLTNLVPRKVRLPALEDIGASQLPKSLDTAVKTAMKSNPEITALAAEIEAAELDKMVAKGRYLPRIDAEYTNTYSLHAGGNTSSAGQKDQRIMAVLNWSLFNGGSDYKGYVERTARHKEFQYRLDDQRRRVVQSLSANYATLATTRERITSGYQELKSISTAAEAMSKRMLSGNQSLLDMLDVYDRLYQVRSRLVSLHVLEMSTAAQLVRLMQGTPGAVSEVKAEPETRLQSK